MLFPAKPQLCKTRHQLAAIAVPDRKNVGDRWRGIGHGELADLLVRESEKAGLNILDEQWQVNPDQADLFGALRFSVTDRYQGRRFSPPRGLEFSLGLRHSNMSRHSIQIVAGATVTVCQNGMFVGEFVVRRKHTTHAHVQLPELIHNGIIDAVEHLRTDLTKEVTAMRRRDLSSRLEASDLIVEAGRRGVVSWSQLGKVDKVWRDPPHPEFRGRNGWSLYNAFTEVAKDFSARQQMDTLKEARELILEPCLN